MRRIAWGLKEQGIKEYKDYKTLIMDIESAKNEDQLREAWEFFMKPEDIPVRFCVECAKGGRRVLAEWSAIHEIGVYLCKDHSQEYVHCKRKDMVECTGAVEKENQEKQRDGSWKCYKCQVKYLYKYTRQVEKHVYGWMRVPHKNTEKREEYERLTVAMERVKSENPEVKQPAEWKELRAERAQYTMFVPRTTKEFIYITWEELKAILTDPIVGKIMEEAEVKESISKFDM